METSNGREYRSLIVDGMALLFRAYYATSVYGEIRKTSSGVPTNAIYGFVQYLFDAVERFDPTHLICCWDMGSKTFRSELYEPYKANRSDPPEDLVPQFDLVKKVADALGIVNIGVPQYEADDCIGTLSRRLSEWSDVVILTGDHDLLQLLSERVSVAILKKGRGQYQVYTPDDLLREKGLTPRQIIDLKGFMSDASDNYPGVRGIGEKTAIRLLQEFSSIDRVVENLDRLPAGVRKKIEADRDMLELSRTLATIKTDVPLACEPDDFAWQGPAETAVGLFEELELGRLLNRFTPRVRRR